MVLSSYALALSATIQIYKNYGENIAREKVQLSSK